MLELPGQMQVFRAGQCGQQHGALLGALCAEIAVLPGHETSKKIRGLCETGGGPPLPPHLISAVMYYLLLRLHSVWCRL